MVTAIQFLKATSIRKPPKTPVCIILLGKVSLLCCPHRAKAFSYIQFDPLSFYLVSFAPHPHAAPL